ncbi:hypothetical protein [Maribacter sp. 2307ULW6-5]|uniref:hypothetical protein n=1 Tax=Maribacter sp. 2307ULW6-5 TaxID=3386275 RepID=UPI0039BD2AA9
MSTMNKDHIRFIHTYLEKSGVRFIDVRMEMVDHVATAVQEGMQVQALPFYDAFKWYMVAHKKELLQGYERLRKDMQRQSLYALGVRMTRPLFLLLFVLAVLVIGLFEKLTQAGFPFLHFIMGLSLTIGVVYFVGLFPKPSKYRFSSLETLITGVLLPLNLCFTFIRLFWGDYIFGTPSSIGTILFTALFFTATIAFLFLFFEKRAAVRRTLGL